MQKNMYFSIKTHEKYVPGTINYKTNIYRDRDKKKLCRDLNQKRFRTPALQHLLQQVINKFCKPKKVSQFLTTLSLGTNLCFISATFFATFLYNFFAGRFTTTKYYKYCNFVENQIVVRSRLRHAMLDIFRPLSHIVTLFITKAYRHKILDPPSAKLMTSFMDDPFFGGSERFYPLPI